MSTEFDLRFWYDLFKAKGDRYGNLTMTHTDCWEMTDLLSECYRLIYGAGIEERARSQYSTAQKRLIE